MTYIRQCARAPCESADKVFPGVDTTWGGHEKAPTLRAGAKRSRYGMTLLGSVARLRGTVLKTANRNRVTLRHCGNSVIELTRCVFQRNALRGNGFPQPRVFLYQRRGGSNKPRIGAQLRQGPRPRDIHPRNRRFPIRYKETRGIGGLFENVAPRAGSVFRCVFHSAPRLAGAGEVVKRDSTSGQAGGYLSLDLINQTVK